MFNSVTIQCGSRIMAVANSTRVVLLGSSVTSSQLRSISMTPCSSAKAAPPKDDRPLLLESTINGVTTLTMNRPEKLNGWTMDMMLAIRGTFQRLSTDPNTKAVIFTGSGKYYCAGVNLSATIKPMHPRKLHGMIVKNNEEIFNAFIDFPKPLLVAANGPAIGACVTSATLADAIVAADCATFSTPFARLGIPPEGCSSIHFERIMSRVDADRMLGAAGWTPTAAEAKTAGLITEVVPSEELMEKSQQMAEQWISEGKTRWMLNKGSAEEYRNVNSKESIDLADAFLSPAFMEGQFKFCRSKGKNAQAAVFLILKMLHPLWSRL